MTDSVFLLSVRLIRQPTPPIHASSVHAPTPVTAQSIRQAGTDLDCGSFFSDHLAEAFDAGAVTESMLDEALTHLAAVQMRLGMFQPRDAPTPFDGLGAADVATEEHTELALDAARQVRTVGATQGHPRQ